MGFSYWLEYDGCVKGTAKRQTGPTFTPAFDAWPDAGVYQLWIELRQPVKVCVGALGEIHFARGMCIYTGRAARGLRARVLRHVRGANRLHWHIDYLLARRGARVGRVVLASMAPNDECRVNCKAANDDGAYGNPQFNLLFAAHEQSLKCREVG